MDWYTSNSYKFNVHFSTDGYSHHGGKCYNCGEKGTFPPFVRKAICATFSVVDKNDAAFSDDYNSLEKDLLALDDPDLYFFKIYSHNRNHHFRILDHYKDAVLKVYFHEETKLYTFLHSREVVDIKEPACD